MYHPSETETQLRHELEAARVRIAKLEASVAEGRQEQERLRQAQNLLNALLASLPDHVYFKDDQSRFICISQSLVGYLGLADTAEAVGKSDFDFFTEAHARPAYETEQEIIRTGRPLLDVEEKETWPNRQETWVVTTKLPLRDEAGQIIGTFGISRDITERKQAEQERQRLQQELIEAQQRAIQDLSTPVIPVMDRILVMPLIGSIDTMRARDITRALLAGIRQHQAKVVILDITGVPLVDSGVALHLHKTIQAARLKGARTIVTGVSEAVAETIVEMGIDWSGVETLSDLQMGLMAALHHLGMKLAR